LARTTGIIPPETAKRKPGEIPRVGDCPKVGKPGITPSSGGNRWWREESVRGPPYKIYDQKKFDAYRERCVPAKPGQTALEAKEPTKKKRKVVTGTKDRGMGGLGVSRGGPFRPWEAVLCRERFYKVGPNWSKAIAMGGLPEERTSTCVGANMAILGVHQPGSPPRVEGGKFVVAHPEKWDAGYKKLQVFEGTSTTEQYKGVFYAGEWKLRSAPQVLSRSKGRGRPAKAMPTAAKAGGYTSELEAALAYDSKIRVSTDSLPRALPWLNYLTPNEERRRKGGAAEKLSDPGDYAAVKEKGVGTPGGLVRQPVQRSNDSQHTVFTGADLTDEGLALWAKVRARNRAFPQEREGVHEWPRELRYVVGPFAYGREKKMLGTKTPYRDGLIAKSLFRGWGDMVKKRKTKLSRSVRNARLQYLADLLRDLHIDSEGMVATKLTPLVDPKPDEAIAPAVIRSKTSSRGRHGAVGAHPMETKEEQQLHAPATSSTGAPPISTPSEEVPEMERQRNPRKKTNRRSQKYR